MLSILFKSLDGSTFFSFQYLVCLILNPTISSIRHYIALLRQEYLLSSLQSRLEQLSSVQNFKPIEIHPYPKDGGVFVHFSYSPTPPGGASDETIALERLESELREEVDKHGPLPSWLGPLGMHLRMGSLWLVKGVPWREVLSIYFFQLFWLNCYNEGHEPLRLSHPQAGL
jgi:hypothetical protein